LSISLENEGFKVDDFNDPVLALSNFEPNFYSLSILDINTHKMNGYELYKELRGLDNKVKVSFLTGSEVYVERLRIKDRAEDFIYNFLKQYKYYI